MQGGSGLVTDSAESDNFGSNSESFDKKYIEYVQIINLKSNNLKKLKLQTHKLQILTLHLTPWHVVVETILCIYVPPFSFSRKTDTVRTVAIIHAECPLYGKQSHDLLFGTFLCHINL